MYSQERQQGDDQSSSTRKLVRRDESSNSARARKLERGSEDNQLRRSKLLFHNMQISDWSVPRESLQELAEKVESRRGRTTNWYRSVEDQRIDLETAFVDNNDSRQSLGPNYTDNLEVFRNSNFEELQNSFHITQKLMLHHQVEILNVKTIERTFLSWTRSTLSHVQMIKWTKARVRVWSDSALRFGKMSDHSEANRRWEGQI